MIGSDGSSAVPHSRAAPLNLLHSPAYGGKKWNQPIRCRFYSRWWLASTSLASPSLSPTLPSVAILIRSNYSSMASGQTPLWLTCTKTGNESVIIDLLFWHASVYMYVWRRQGARVCCTATSSLVKLRSLKSGTADHSETSYSLNLFFLFILNLKMHCFFVLSISDDNNRRKYSEQAFFGALSFSTHRSNW